MKLSDIVKKYSDDSYVFEDSFSDFLLSNQFEQKYGKYVPFSYKFRKINGKIFFPPLEENFFNSVLSITVNDMLEKNYTPLEIQIKNGVIFVLNGHHRILRFLILCLEHNIDIDLINLNYTLVEIL